MLYPKIDLRKLYEQAAEPGATAQNDQPIVDQAPVSTRLFAVPFNAQTIASLNELITKGTGIWKSETPLNSMSKDGVTGQPGAISGKPVYLMIRLSTKSERASTETQLELADRIYVLLDTTAPQLKRYISNVGVESRAAAAVKSPDGQAYTIEMWSEKTNAPEETKTEPVANQEVQKPAETQNVTVDLEAQKQNPGTAAGIQGTQITEDKMNEQTRWDTTQMEPQGNKDAKKRIEQEKLDQNSMKAAQAKQVAKQTITPKVAKGPVIVKQDNPTTQAMTVNRYLVKDGGVWIWKIDSPQTYKAIVQALKIPSKAVPASTVMAAENISKFKTDIAPITSETYEKILGVKAVQPVIPPTGFDEAQGNAYRAWANSTPELKKKYGTDSVFDLDPKGKPDNSYIRKSYAAGKDAYAKYLKEKGPEEENSTDAPKWKEGDLVWYRIIEKKDKPETEGKEDKETKEDDGSGDLHGELGHRPEDEVESPREKKEREAREFLASMTPRERKYFLAQNESRVIEASIASSFNDFVAITEEDDVAAEDVDAQGALIKDFREKKIKKAKVVTVLDDKKMKITDEDGENEREIFLTQIIPNDKAKAAKAKADAAIAADEKEAAAAKTPEDKFHDAKEKTSDMKDELKSKKSELKTAKKKKKDKKKFTRKAKRQENKQSRIKKRTDKKQAKIDNLGESRVFNFEEFFASKS